MKSYIFIGGKVYPSMNELKINDCDLVIAADSGYDNAKSLGYADRVQYVVGDFDSVKEKKFRSRVKLIRVPAEKDESDTQLALNLALKHGATEIVIIGGLSGRLDHTLSNLYLLVSLFLSGVRATVCDGRNRVQYLDNATFTVPKSDYKYFSLIPVTKEVRGVYVDGAKYTLEDATLSRVNPSLAISNEVIGDSAIISCKQGGLFIVESKNIVYK